MADDENGDPSDGFQKRVVASRDAPAGTEVELLIDGEPFGTILIPAGETSGEVSINIPQDTQPVTFTLTARSGVTEASVDVTIQ